VDQAAQPPPLQGLASRRDRFQESYPWLLTCAPPGPNAAAIQVVQQCRGGVCRCGNVAIDISDVREDHYHKYVVGGRCGADGTARSDDEA
jgi:hypothetical protein